MWWTPIVLCAAVIATGCNVRRLYHAPTPAAPAAWTGAAQAASEAAPAPPDVQVLSAWWDSFGDPQLTSLVRRAVAGNLDVRTALSRLREARASVVSARASLRPSADASGSVRVSGTGSEAGIGGTTRSYSLGLDASWEADVFGGIRSAVDAAAATAESREADLQDVLVSLTAETALDYIDIRSLQRRLEIARANVGLQEQTLELTRFRSLAGLATDLDVQQALSNVESTRAQIASIESQTARAVHALAVLLGQPPAALNQELAGAGAIPAAPVTVAVGVPAETLRRRPDVRSAERQLAAQFAQVNAARADLYPTFRLAGSIGIESLSLARLLVPGAGFWSASPSVSTRLFNRQQLRQNLVIQNERQEQAARTYESRVLGALQDVEDSLTALAQEQVRRDHLSAAATAAEQAADLSLQLYTAGLRDFRDVLDAQRSLLSLQDSLTTSGASVSTDLVRLYKALGGGWSAASLLPAPRLVVHRFALPRTARGGNLRRTRTSHLALGRRLIDLEPEQQERACRQERAESEQQRDRRQRIPCGEQEPGDDRREHGTAASHADGKASAERCGRACPSVAAARRVRPIAGLRSTNDIPLMFPCIVLSNERRSFSARHDVTARGHGINLGARWRY